MAKDGGLTIRSPLKYCNIFRIDETRLLTMERVNETLRNRKSAAKVIRELDAFPKVAKDYQETSASGGTGKVDCFLNELH